MTDVDQTVKMVTEKVQKHVRWIKPHYELRYGRFPSIGLLSPDPYVEEAKAVLLYPSILERLCPALRSITGDIFEISKVLVGVLVPLSIAGTIAIPWDPLVIAAGAFLIARAGVASICKDVEGDKSREG